MNSLTQTETARSNTPSHAPEMPLRGRRLILARATWAVLVSFALVFFVANLPLYFTHLQTICVGTVCADKQLTPATAQTLQEVGISISVYAAFAFALTLFSLVIWLAVGGVLAWRKSDDWMALLVALTLVLQGIANLTGASSSGYYAQLALSFSAQLLNFFAFTTLYFVIFLFPNGRFVTDWLAWLTIPILANGVWYNFFSNGHSGLDLPGWVNGLSNLLFVGLVLSGGVAQIYRYRQVSTSVQRQQTKWVVFGIAVNLVVVLGLFLPTLIDPILSRPGSLYNVALTPITTLSALLLPLSIGIAVLHYHLWDIDMLINRTLVYGLLTAFVVGLYVLIVGGLSTVLQGQGNLVLSLGATALIAVLFEPLRDQLQRRINRLMYGERDDPYRLLSRLGQRLEATLAPEQVLPTIVQTTAQALKLPYVAVTVKQDEALMTVTSSGTATTDLVHLPLSYQGEHIGELLLAPRAPGEAFTAADRRLLNDLARQTGVAVYAVRLTTDLQRLARDLQESRTQLVTTREEERRRLRRDLHDGLGSVLTSLNLRAGAIRALLERDSAAAEALVVEQQSAIRAAIADIRRLVYDLRPPSLDELGLLGALRERAAHYGSTAGQVLQQEPSSGLRVEVQASEELPALSAALEVATYRIVQEALSNVARHAHARTCTIRLALGDGLLQVEITDDGIGLPSAQRGGVGLLSMRERAAELGGTCQIEALPARGTRVWARLPLPAA